MNTKKLELLFKQYKFNAVFHLAALTDVKESSLKSKKYYRNNVLVTKNILDMIVKYKVKSLIFSSSAAVYGNKKKHCINENMNTNPINNYGRNKLECEKLIKTYSKNYKFHYAILRYFNVIGADEKLRSGQLYGKSLFNNIVNSILNKKLSINIYGSSFKTKDGTAIRDYIDINDLSKLHQLVLNKLFKNNSILINCGSNRGYTVLEIVNTFNKYLENKISIKFKEKRAEDIGKIYSGNAKLNILFPKWKIENSLNKSIENLLKWKKIIR
tara:strand:+ start:11 stop:820 length:810 start_codon:yes stop_codon:yes gene_type:complete